jgi:uncharacterized protein
MNNFYSSNELYYPRWITPLLQNALNSHPVLILTGARQVGKSTLLNKELPFAEWRYHTLDNLDTLAQAQSDPASLWAGSNRVVLDEVQRVPNVLLAVKQAVDEDPKRYRFVLSGSANLLLMQHVTESLAGRAAYFVLHPLTLGEQRQQPPSMLLRQLLSGQWPEETSLSGDVVDPLPLMLRGSMPGLVNLPNPTDWLRWWEGYILTYLERDLRQLSQITSLVDFRNLLQLLALHTGKLLNQSEIGREVGLAQPSAHRYINLVETTHLLERLPPYTAARMQRLVKSPKIFWTDPGLPVYLSGLYDEESLQDARELGSFFENLVYQHLRVQCEMMTPKARLFFWRTRQGDEVDFVVEQGRRLLAVEVKGTGTPRYQHTEGLRAFLGAHPQAQGGILLHQGDSVKYLGDRILAIPWTLLAV